MKGTLGAGALCLAIGLGLGALFTGSPPATTVGSTPRASPGPAGDAMSRAELTSIIRQELARERGASTSAGVATGATTAAAGHNDDGNDAPVDRSTLSPALVDKSERATQIVGSALSRGAWTEADKAALSIELEGLPGPLMAEIAGELAAAVNRGDVRLDLDPDSMPL